MHCIVSSFSLVSHTYTFPQCIALIIYYYFQDNSTHNAIIFICWWLHSEGKDKDSIIWECYLVWELSTHLSHSSYLCYCKTRTGVKWVCIVLNVLFLEKATILDKILGTFSVVCTFCIFVVSLPNQCCFRDLIIAKGHHI